MRSIPVGITMSDARRAAGTCSARRDRLVLRSLRHGLLCVTALVTALVASPAISQSDVLSAPGFRPNFRPGHADALPVTISQSLADENAVPGGFQHRLAEIAPDEPAASALATVEEGPAMPSSHNRVSASHPNAALVSARVPAFVAAMTQLTPPPPLPPKPQGRAPVLTRAPVPLLQASEPEVAISIPPPIRGTIVEVGLSDGAVDVAATGSLPAAGQALVASTEPSLLMGGTDAAARSRSSALEMPRPRKARAVTTPGGMRLAEAVASAVTTFPEIRINEARVREARAGIAASEAGLYPNAELRVSAGQNFSGSYEGTAVPYRRASNAVDSRADAGIILRQLVFDFGATRADIRRAELLRDSEKLKLRDKVEDIAHRTAQNFLKVLEQREMLELIDEIIAAHEHLARVVQAHAKEGHGTLADVNRVASRLVDVRGIRSDISLVLMSAEDQFQRLTRRRAAAMADVPDLAASLPKSTAEAVQRVIGGNPRLGAIAASRHSAQQELEYQRASSLPRINLEIDGEARNFRNRDVDFGQSSARTQIEGRAMLSMRYRFMDGGLNSAQREQIHARIEGSEMTYTNEREQMEADIRQAYRAMESAKRKGRLVAEGVTSAGRVRELYLEQFKGGKRTIFELLDGQMSYYTARRSQIESRYEGRRASFDILRAMGELTSTLAGTVPRGS
jgi:outer membrane protein, adhesin transport system